jgi:beta-galactosidase
MTRFYLFFCSFFLWQITAHGQRWTEPLMRDWRFDRYGKMPDGSQRAEPAGLEKSDAADQDWRRVDLPHDWGIEGPFRTELPGNTGKLPWVGIGWYRHHFQHAADRPGQRTYLQVDGAMSQPTVYLNGQKIGEWKYGYLPFQLELTSALKLGDNVLAIRLENLPDSSRWYPGGGLYRGVRLVHTAADAIAANGLFVRTPEVTPEQAKLSITTRLSVKVREALTLKHTLLAPSGGVVASKEVPVQDERAVETEFILSKPLRWDTEHPHLYQLSTQLLVGGAEIDHVTTPIGIRSVKWTAAEGFHLNDKPLKLQGVCLHHDLGPLGAAFHRSALRRQLRILREMGVNAIRTTHNPPAPELFQLCDELGLLVIAELYDHWHLAKSPNDYSLFFDAWHERDVRQFVELFRNHPCLILWSSGNEILEQKGGEENLARSRRLTALFHEADPSRQVTLGMNFGVALTNGFAATADIAGYNYKNLRSGKKETYATHLENYPKLPFYGSETASTLSTRDTYFFPVKNDKGAGFRDFQVSSYDLYAPRWGNAPDDDFHSQDQLPGYGGEFVWTGFDYLGEPTPYNEDKWQREPPAAAPTSASSIWPGCRRTAIIFISRAGARSYPWRTCYRTGPGQGVRGKSLRCTCIPVGMRLNSSSTASL